MLAKIKSNAIGVDAIKLIKIILPSTVNIIEHIFNHSLMHGEVPRIWKSAQIVALPNVKNPNLIQHYRPISILPAIFKVLERIVSEQIIDYLKKKDILDPYQFAYRRNASTQTCIIRMLDDVRFAADHRKVTVSVFFDFTKAFDKVNYNILLNKLKSMNFSELVHR